jgi:FkbM family methyltransferase
MPDQVRPYEKVTGFFMVLANTSPIRQLRRAYGSMLRLAASAEQISSSLQRMAAAEWEPVPASTRAAELDVAVAIYERLGCKLLLDRSSLVDRCVIEGGSWEPAQLDYFQDLVRDYYDDAQDTVFLDIGAYWGLYSLQFAKAGLASEIVAFEADRHNFAQLQSNIFLNNEARRITAHNKAITERNQTMHAWESTSHPDGNRGGVGLVNLNLGFQTLEVEGVALDSFLELHDRSLIIKIDVEGHEQHVLQGMEEILRNNRVLMQIEIYEQQQAVTFAILERYGLRRLHQIEHDFYYTNQ